MYAQEFNFNYKKIYYRNFNFILFINDDKLIIFDYIVVIVWFMLKYHIQLWDKQDRVQGV